jgi:hypothetical protein
MRQGAGVIAVITAGLAVAATAATQSLAQPAGAAVSGRITLRSSETLKEPHVTNGGVAGRGRFIISGAIADKGTLIDYRTQKGNIAHLRRVAIGTKGTITFTITINLATGAEPWTVASGTRLYTGLHGRGTVTLDAWYTSPATFVMKGIVSE